MRVAVIDDGVSSKAVACPVQKYQSDGNSIVMGDGDAYASPSSHGSLCARLIVKGIKDISIISIKISDEYSIGAADDLIKALEWCIDNDIDCINISSGYTVYFDNDRINTLCYNLARGGTKILAAVSNWDQYTVPANLPYVFAVSCRKHDRKTRFIRSDIKMKGLYFEIRGRRCHVGSYSSMACARACNYFLKHKSLDKVIDPKIAIYDFKQIKNAYIYSENSLDEDVIFPQMNDPDTIEGSFSLLLYKVDYESDATLSLLKSVRKRIDHLIFCESHAPHRIKKWAVKNRIRYWDESLLLTRGGYNECPVPVISIFTGKEGRHLARTLYGKITSYGYRACVFTGEPNGYLYGFDMIRTMKDISVRYMHYSPDIVLIITDDGKIAECCDMSITKKETGYILSDEGLILIEDDDPERFCGRTIAALKD